MFGAHQSRFVAATSSPALQGALSAALNPKLAVFFLTFLPQFVDPDHMPQASMLAHGLVFALMGAAWLVVWVLLLDRLGRVIRRPERARVDGARDGRRARRHGRAARARALTRALLSMSFVIGVIPCLL